MSQKVFFCLWCELASRNTFLREDLSGSFQKCPLMSKVNKVQGLLNYWMYKGSRKKVIRPYSPLALSGHIFQIFLELQKNFFFLVARPFNPLQIKNNFFSASLRQCASLIHRDVSNSS